MDYFSDGTIQLYAVFHGDGYECSDFVGIFETEDQANVCAEALKIRVQENWVTLWEGSPLEGFREGPADIISVVPVTVGKYELPPARASCRPEFLEK